MENSYDIDSDELTRVLSGCGAKAYYHDVNGNCIMVMNDGAEIKLEALIERELKSMDAWDRELEGEAEEWFHMTFGEMRKKIDAGVPVPPIIKEWAKFSGQNFKRLDSCALFSRYYLLGIIPRRFPDASDEKPDGEIIPPHAEGGAPTTDAGDKQALGPPGEKQSIEGGQRPALNNEDTVPRSLYDNLAVEHRLAVDAVQRYKKRILIMCINRPSEEKMREWADKTRKKNNSLNFSALAKELGRSDKTVKTWCLQYGIK